MNRRYSFKWCQSVRLGYAWRSLYLIWALALSGLSTSAFARQLADSNGRPVKIGLALGGGGTRGCAHIGVIRVLEREGIRADMIAGTSMGAIVGGLHAAGLSVDEITGMIHNKRLLHAYDTVPIPVRVAVIPVFFLPHLVGYHPYDGLYKGNKFANFLSGAVPPERRNIESFPIAFAAVASSLLDGKSYGITSGDIGRAIQASSALPFLRRPVDWQGQLYADGGLVENLPVARVRGMGADVVIAVDVDDNQKTLQKKDFRKIGSTLDRAINMHLAAVDRQECEQADVIIHPDVTGIKLLSRKMSDVDRAIAAGETAATAALPAIRDKIRRMQTASR